ncbi:MAG: aldo/keto reductase [Alistipes indistinctus]
MTLRENHRPVLHVALQRYRFERHRPARAAAQATWMQGRRFGGNASESDVREWIESLNLNLGGNTDVSSFNLAAGVNGKAPTVRLSSGYDMPILGLGTYSLHGDVCKNSVKAALASGFRKFDTASIYGNEEEIGEELSANRTCRARRDIRHHQALSQSVSPMRKQPSEECLEKLNYRLHRPGAPAPSRHERRGGIHKTMERAVAQGKIRSLGLSELTMWRR